MSLTDYVRGHEAGLLQGQTVGESLERERIIKLLEEWGQEADCFCCASDVAASQIIELIKGEQK